MEIEAKFTIPHLEAFGQLREMTSLGPYALSGGGTRRMFDTYLDTADRRILAAGYSLRRRVLSDGIRCTLKALGKTEGPIHHREELELLLDQDLEPTEWPDSPARQRVMEIVGGARLAPLFDLQQIRTLRPLGKDGVDIAEMSLDDVRVGIGDREQAYFELEVELGPAGSEADLETVASLLQSEWGLTPEPRSKFERALALLDESRPASRLLTPSEQVICQAVVARGDQWHLLFDQPLTFRPTSSGIIASILDDGDSSPVAASASESCMVAPEAASPEKPTLTLDETMAEAARLTLRYHYLTMCYHEPGTRRGEDIEELHDMRVAVRRMRMALEVFGEYLDPAVMAPFASGLRRTGRTLGSVRDLDVFREKAQRYVDGLKAEQADSLAPLFEEIAREREAARGEMLAYLESKRYRKFVERFGEYLERPGAGALPVTIDGIHPVPHRLRHVVPIKIQQRLAGVRCYDQWLSEENTPLARLHQLRIDFKGLRYTLEFFRDVLGPDAKALIEEIKSLQDHLGDIQDCVVAGELLRHFLAWGTLDATPPAGFQGTMTIVAPGVATYLAARLTELQRLTVTFPEAWARFNHLEVRDRFTQSIAGMW